MAKSNEQNINYYKQELIKRYKYLYENITYVFAPYMYKQTQEEYKIMIEKYQKQKIKMEKVIKRPIIYIKEFESETLLLLEKFLLEETIIEESDFYKKLESLKQNKEYLQKIKNGCVLLEECNKDRTEYAKEKFTLWKLLSNVRTFINNQSGDLKNKRLKVEALDEYFRLDRYKNDGKVWKSGFELLACDTNNYEFFSMIVDKNQKNHTPNREKYDIGVKNNEFINCFSNTSLIKSKDNSIHLTEKEKQCVYLSLHDELPWDLEVKCNIEEETELLRPNHTEPCGEKFYVKEEEIFIKDDMFYQLCPECGYIVNIPNELLSDKISLRIIERCSKDINLFRKMELYSELKALDLNSKIDQKRLLKK